MGGFFYLGLIKLVKRSVKLWQVCMVFNLFLPTRVKKDLQNAQNKIMSKCLVKTRSSISSSPPHPFQHKLILLWHWNKEIQTEIPSALAACLNYSVCKVSLKTPLEWKWIQWRQFIATISDSFITKHTRQFSFMTYIGGKDICIYNTWQTHTENGDSWVLTWNLQEYFKRRVIAAILHMDNESRENFSQFHFKCSLVHTKTTPLPSIPSN